MIQLLQRPMRRMPFVIGTTALLIVSFLLLRLILIAFEGYKHSFPNGWELLDPIGLILGDGTPYRLTLLVHLALTAGLVLIGVRRAVDAGWRAWTGALFSIPVVRLFVFVVLAMAPTRQVPASSIGPRTGLIARMLPRSREGSAVASVLVTVLLVIPLGAVNVRVLEDYGLALFIGIPFLLGAVSAYLYSYHHTRTMLESITVAAITLLAVLAIIFFLAMEGLVCLIMAAPIAGAITMVGAVIGHALGNNEHGSLPTMRILVLLTPALMAFEHVGRSETPLLQVTTRITVNAAPQRVWDQLVTFSHMEPPKELIFRAGIAYPIEARITGSGVGACRYCQFNTGPFVEPITTWDEPHKLAFEVQAFPPPMHELSIYEHVNAPHIHGFFQSHHGQFLLTEQADGTTLLEGTTWYTHEIWPTWYWQLWSDGILHAIHGRVLEHIKREAEGA